MLPMGIEGNRSCFYWGGSRAGERIIQAHRLHHVVETKAGTVSFGFLWAPKPEELKAELARRQRAGVRAPAHKAVVNEPA